MKKENVIVKKNTAEHLAPGGRGWHVVPGEGVSKEADLMGTPSSPLQGTSPARGEVNDGFTLIELLVVVLIIGILAAVAVPQYQKAVEKSRVAEALIVTKALAQAEQTYYLANGDYSYDISLLDLDIPGVSATLGTGKNETKAIRTNYFTCRASNTSTSTLWKDALSVCERYTGDYSIVRIKDGNDYCVYYTNFGEQICKSFGKEKVPEVRADTYRI